MPIVDCFQKIRQQVKCYLQMSGAMGKNELQEVRTAAEILTYPEIAIFAFFLHFVL